MELMTHEIRVQSKAQYPLGSDMEQLVVAKWFDPCGSWTWYLMNSDPDDRDYCWGIVSGLEVEMGSFSLDELAGIRNRFGLGIERDLHFKPRSAQSIWDDLMAGKHV